ncbi:sulfatase-like hydrolase/transferase [Flammeovirga yaeyamensis]|uniref:Sulfatase-like hydrolase/transferase n=1 Tax=Flammeovirga yaeyamensis TaxID=367791 RepID=A0AAX1N509_9BACT|nr:sulfatase-like hydrolase/transferase [Flammeovirga yaeyamensis]MBB3698504.1 arylsulfatase A-like enzyme [Flammeovirga yaeyamensis]NMF34147.1 sulfatase-like hydrolase/transferase [Flammeovirga yaeyamensis]QWG01132.1 sulfatase-like hydrolase/transferase [Flammeovirga yaeyamensis]
MKTDQKKEIDKPNVILIVADDMGMGDAGYLGANDIRTPNIDLLAKSGIQFNQGYVTASVCGPSRSGMMTGVYQQRFGYGANIPEEKWITGELDSLGIPTTQPMMAELLKEQGYTTQLVGKWHLGLDDHLRPNERGFDEFYGFLNGSHDYYRAEKEFTKNRDFWPIFRNKEMVDYEGYTTEVFTDETVNFIKKNKDRPFFSYVSYNAVHYPWQVPQKYIDRLGHIEEEERRLFSGMTLAMDDGIGRIVEALKEEGIYENTIIIFVADNGSPASEQGRMSRTGGLRGWKGDTYEGGIKVPYIISWPKNVMGGTVFNDPVSTLDIVPTVCGVLGVHENGAEIGFDGVNLIPFINGDKEGRPHEQLYFRRVKDFAFRQGDYKIAFNKREKDLGVQLFNLKIDPNEQNNLADQEKEIFNEMLETFHRWDSKLPANRWLGHPYNRRVEQLSK